MPPRAPEEYDPETLDLLHRAYMEASNEFKAIKPDVNHGGLDGVELTLAGRILAAAQSGERDVEALKRHALAAVVPASAPTQTTES